MIELTIETTKGGKGRSFQATMVASMTANHLWEQGRSGNDERPVWAVLAGTDAALRSFVANLQAGRKAEVDNGRYSRRGAEKIEFLKTSRFTYLWSRQAAGTMVTVYHPGLFSMDPGMVDPKGVAFICAPPQAWVEAQRIDAAPIIQHLRQLGSKLADEDIVDALPMAYLWCVYLDRRTRFPLINDGRFYAQLFFSAIDMWTAIYPNYRNFTVRDTQRVGIVAKPVAFHASHDHVGAMLTAETTKFFAATGS